MLNRFISEKGIAVEVILKDNAGVVIDPTLGTITDIEIILQNKMDGSVMEKFSRELKDGWTQAEVDSTHLICWISTLDTTKGQIEGQVNIILPNSQTGQTVVTQKGVLFSLMESYNG